MKTKPVPLLCVEDGISDMLANSVLRKFATHMLPRPQDAETNLRLSDVGRLMPWHGAVHPQEIVDGINRLVKDAASDLPVFFSFYNRSALAENTGLFFFRGRADAPFALICPGGGFRYVGSLHEGFPLAQFLSSRGINAFVLQYRTGGEKIACEDMAAALTWIFAHARELDISTRDYSVWGGSAGARMAANLGTFGSAFFGGADLPKPCAVIMAYTGHTRTGPDEPPTFAIVSKDDPIAPYRLMKERIAALKSRGVDAEIVVVSHAGHGFGLGTGTDAEGWAEQALQFWQKHTRL